MDQGQIGHNQWILHTGLPIDGQYICNAFLADIAKGNFYPLENIYELEKVILLLNFKNTAP